MHETSALACHQVGKEEQREGLGGGDNAAVVVDRGDAQMFAVLLEQQEAERDGLLQRGDQLLELLLREGGVPSDEG